jgi:hypothetical protein
MADTAVAITAGVGTNIDTRTESTNSNHRQVVVIGDPATNAGVAPVDVTNGLAVQIIPALPAGTNNIGDVDVLTINGVAPAFGSGANGATVLRTALATDSPGVIATGTAGTAASNVITVQGIASMTPVTVSNTPLTNFGAGEYETVAASQTDQILGATGAVGDYLAGILITPTTTGAGSVSIKDGNGSAIPIFNTGTLSNLVPFFVPLGIITVNATTPGWKVTTGANVTVVGIGNFT